MDSLVRQSKIVLFLTAFLLFSFLASAQVQPSSSGSDSTLPEFRIKELAMKATLIAHTRLAADPKDKIGLILVKFANHLYPKYRTLLLLRACLKYNVKITKPEEEANEKEFLGLLVKMTQAMAERLNNEKCRHLLVTCYAVLKEFQPDNEEALVTLMAAEDSGQEVKLDKLLAKNFWEFQNVEYDPKDPRYVISSVQKTVFVSADVPWTDTWVKVGAGKVIRVKASGDWCIGSSPFARVGPEGYDGTVIDKVVGGDVRRNQGSAARSVVLKKYKGELEAQPGSLIAKIGNKMYPIGQEATFTATEAGILYFGPYELDSFADNAGQLMVSFSISDK